jgi:hypothetical protein
MPVFACDSGEACQTQFSAESSLSQGEAFAKMTRAYHGGRRTRRSTRRSGRKMRGGAMLEMTDYATAFDALPASLHEQAGVASLDAAIGELAQFSGSGAGTVDAAAPGPVQMGGKRKRSTRKRSTRKRSTRKRSTRKRGGMSPIDAPSMLLRPEDEPAAFLNPQWYDENMVNPNFKAPNSPYADSQKGGKRKSRKVHRKASKKSRKSRKSSKKSHKSRKAMKGGKKSRKSRKASKKSSRKAHRKH